MSIRTSKIIIKSYIAPWALIKEEIPIHVILDPEAKYDTLHLEIPDGITVTEFYNIKSVKDEDRTIIVESLYTRNFFGFMIRNDVNFQEIHTQRVINIKILFNGAIVDEKNFIANFYRPCLEVINQPTEIVITDSSSLKDIFSFSIKVCGFGRISVKTEVEAPSDINVILDSFLQDTARRIITRYSVGEKVKPDDERFEDKKWFLEQYERFLNDVPEDEIPNEMKEEILAETREFINKMKNWGKILEEITLAWEELFLEILLFQFERYPIEDVRLIFGNPCFFAQKLGGLLTIRIRYWDSLGNEYKPISIPIEVIDKRTRKSPQDVPININWIRERIIPGELD